MEISGKKVFYTFGGHSVPTWLRELKRYKKEEYMKPFFQRVFQGIRKAKDILQGAPLWRTSFPLEEWLEKDPPSSLLIYSPIQMPGILITQMAHIFFLREKFSPSEILSSSLATTGHSQGLVTAAYFALGEDPSLDHLENFLLYIFVLSYLAQERFSEVEYEERSPMVALLGGDHEEKKNWIEEINPSLEKKIYIGLYNTPTNRILCSYVESLEKFYEKFSSLIEEKGYKWIYLKSSCAFHSPYMEGVPEKVEEKVKDFFPYKGEDLKIPVYSFSDGKNLQEEENLALRLAKDLLFHTLYWEKALQIDGADFLLDFGPGKANTRLIEENIRKKVPVFLFLKEFL